MLRSIVLQTTRHNRRCRRSSQGVGGVDLQLLIKHLTVVDCSITPLPKGRKWEVQYITVVLFLKAFLKNFCLTNTCIFIKKKPSQSITQCELSKPKICLLPFSRFLCLNRNASITSYVCESSVTFCHRLKACKWQIDCI